MKKQTFIEYIKELAKNKFDLLDDKVEMLEDIKNKGGYNYITDGSINDLVYYEDTVKVYDDFFGNSEDEDQFFKNEKVWKEAGKVLESLKLEDIK